MSFFSDIGESLGGGPGGGILGSLFGGSGSQIQAGTQEAVANQDTLGKDRQFYADQLRMLYEDPSAFLAKIPGYQFQLDQGEDAIKRNAAATGGLRSGKLSGDLLKYSQGLASGTINDYTNILTRLSMSGSPGYADILTGGNLARVGGNQEIGGNIVGLLSGLFGGGGNGSSMSSLFGMFGGGGGGGSSFGSDWTFGDTSGGSSFDMGSGNWFGDGGMDLSGGP